MEILIGLALMPFAVAGLVMLVALAHTVVIVVYGSVLLGVTKLYGLLLRRDVRKAERARAARDVNRGGQP